MGFVASGHGFSALFIKIDTNVLLGVETSPVEVGLLFTFDIHIVAQLLQVDFELIYDALEHTVLIQLLA